MVSRGRIAWLCWLGLGVVFILCTWTIAADPDFSWREPHATVLPNGDLQWSPVPFVFQTGDTVKYIDFQAGDDNNEGTQDAPWKHHPWDPAAEAKAKEQSGPCTYVFKCGVTYRGELRPVGDAGRAEEPIRLTSDPNWGEGEARMYGSEKVTGWVQGADHPNIPNAEKVWYVDLPFATRNVCMIDGNGDITRLKLARTPNWQESDPDDVMSEWWQWENPEWWKAFQGNCPHVAMIKGKKFHVGVDTKNLDMNEDFSGAYAWTEWGQPTMGSPYAATIHGKDVKQTGLIFGGPWFDGLCAQIQRGNRYYLENKPRWLDEAGEYWFQKKGEGGRLYVRLPQDVDPNTVTVEAARILNILDASELRHVVIQGITFRFTNAFWDLGAPQWADPNIKSAVLRLRGAGKDIQVDHCTFEHTPMPIRIEVGENKTINNVRITDNLIRHTDHGAISLEGKEPSMWAKQKDQAFPYGQLGQVEVLRNKLYHIGWRNIRGAHGTAIHVNWALRNHIAGNIIHRCTAAGIDVMGGKASGSPRDVPFARSLIHHNKVVDSLLKSSDWGGIETWQGGPHYVYNNISVNPGGIMSFSMGYGDEKKNEDGTPRFGHAFYTDGSFKNYHFNNIAVGKNNDLGSKYANNSAFQSLIGFENAIFNCTAYKFVDPMRRQGAAGSRRQKYLGNLIQDASGAAFRHSEQKGKKDPNDPHYQADGGYDFETMAYAENVLAEITGQVGILAPGESYDNIEEMAKALKQYGAMKWNVDVRSESPLLRNPAQGDYRPVPDSPVIDHGVKMFVPWALYGTVGEWNFYLDRQNPTRILDEHWYMMDYYGKRNDYWQLPRYDLIAEGITEENFAEGPLEDWIRGALRLNGEEQYLRLRHETLASPVTVSMKIKKKGEVTETWKGDEKPTVNMQENNFLIEVYLKTDDADGVICAKSAEAGYVLEIVGGAPRLRLRSGGQDVYSLTANQDIHDGQWTHLLVEVDRKSGAVFYINGKKVAGEQHGAMTTASLRNDADFFVGGGPDRDSLACTMEFLRVARGTLADAHTTIQELYAWEFDGPHLYDFTGAAPIDKRDAGAIEAR